MKKETEYVTVNDIKIQDEVLVLSGSKDSDIIKEAKVKFAGFIADINKHIASLKEDDYELYVIGAGTNVEGLKSEIEESIKLIKVSKAVARLEDQSDDFKLLIEAYTVDRAKSLSNVLTSRRPLPYDVRNLTEQSLSAIGFFQEYLYTVSVENADKSILIQNSISLGLYEKSIEVVNGLIRDRDAKTLKDGDA